MNDDINKVSSDYLYDLQNFPSNDFDVHKNNLVKKLQNTINGDDSAVFKTIDDIKAFIDPYITFRKDLNYLIENFTEDNMNETHVKMVSALQTYKDIAYKINNFKSGGLVKKGQYFTSQSKYEPTILEEFMGFLLSPLIKDLQNIKCGPVKAYSEMGIDVSIDKNNAAFTNLEQKTKNQDFSLYTEKHIPSDNLTLQIPLISIECKTYIDKTMLEGSINTAERIKSGNPKSKFYVVSETWDLSDDESINPNEIDNVFVIRKCKRRADEDIDVDVIKDIYSIIKNDLSGLKLNTKPLDQIRKTGKLKM